MILGQCHTFFTSVDFDLLDAGNVVYHPNYLILCERARNAALADAGYGFDQLWSERSALAVLECNAKFSKALTLNQQVAILTQTLSVTGSRLIVQQRICDRASLPSNHQSKFIEVTPLQLGRDVYFDVQLTLGFVKLYPLKAARFPPKLVAQLRLRPVAL